MVIATQVDTSTDEETEVDSLNVLKSSKSLRAQNPDYVLIKQRLAQYPVVVREFATKNLASEAKQDITIALKNRKEQVPRLALKHLVSEQRVNLALDVLWLIRQV